MHVLTNYKQLLLYISHNKNNLYKFVTSRAEPNVLAYVVLGILGYCFCKHNSGNYRTLTSIIVTEFAKRGLIHSSDFPTLTKRNFICKQVIRLKFSIVLVQ